MSEVTEASAREGERVSSYFGPTSTGFLKTSRTRPGTQILPIFDLPETVGQ